jgi:hypothetical protein
MDHNFGKKRLFKSTRFSESESSSSWENKHSSSSSSSLSSTSKLNMISDFGDSILLKSPERRLKLTIRVKRSPATKNSCNMNRGFDLGDTLNMNGDNEPEYEILRTEGIDNSETDSNLSLNFSGVKKNKHKKRHKRKKNKSKKFRKEKLDFHEKQVLNDTDNHSITTSTDVSRCKKSELKHNFPTAKRVKLMFGNEMKILNIPEKVEDTEKDKESFVINKSSSNLLSAKSILVTNIFN